VSLVVLLVSTFAFGADLHQMKCKRISDDWTMERCENDEAVFYILGKQFKMLPKHKAKSIFHDPNATYLEAPMQQKDYNQKAAEYLKKKVELPEYNLCGDPDYWTAISGIPEFFESERKRCNMINKK